jgi:ribose 5-phosphate isomerase B
MTGIIAVGADHAGFRMKEEVVRWLRAEGYEVSDLGAHSLEPADDYPDFAEAVAHAVSSGEAAQGVLICGSGVGATVAANKVPGCRACVCHDTYSAHQGVEHDDMNVLCVGARIVGLELARELVTAFLSARFTGEERHRRRLEKVAAIEHQALQAGSAHNGGLPR